MADRRLDLLTNAEAALKVDSVDVNGEETAKPANLRVERHMTRGTDVTLLPDISLEYMGEVTTPMLEGAVDVSERGVRMGARCRAAAAKDQTADDALIPILAWAELALLGVDFTLGGVAAWGFLERIDPLGPEEIADTFVGCRMVFVFDVHTKLFDPRQAP